MAKILWLDDQEWEVSHFCDALRNKGHSVELTDSEDEVLRNLQSGILPDLFIQDLGRTVSYLLMDEGKLNTYNGFLEDAGWRFYKRFLQTGFPMLPVIICSNLGSDHIAKTRSNDFNVTLIQKNNFDTTTLLSKVDEVLASISTLLEVSLQPPLFVALDFDRINSALLNHLKNKPQDIHNLKWQKFEELTALLLKELGYDVERTKLTRDDGVDLWALKRSDLGEILYAIDVKKYRPNRLIGPLPVRAIYGVTENNRANVGMIITTSSFTKTARDFQKTARHRISLKEYQDLVDWLKMVAS